MTASAQVDSEVLTVDNTGFASIVATMLPEGLWVNNTDTGLLYLTQYVAGVMSLVLKGASQTPASPTYYVASTGSDAITSPGTSAQPLASPQEACRRLGITGWTGFPLVITKDAVNLGADPLLNVPAPASGAARPITFQSTFAVDVAGIVSIGGAAASPTACTPNTFASADGSAVNVHRGKILLVTAGPLAGQRFIIDSNDGAGGFSFLGPTLVAPAAGNTFSVLSRVGSWTWSGIHTFECAGGAMLNGMEMLPTGATTYPTAFFKVGGLLIENACRWLSVAQFAIYQDIGSWKTCNYFYPVATAPFWPALPAGITPCGNRYDGSANAAQPLGINESRGGYSSPLFSPNDIEFSYCSFQSADVAAKTNQTVVVNVCQLTDAGIVSNGFTSKVTIGSTRITNGRISPWASFFAGGIVGAALGGQVQVAYLVFVTPSATDNLVSITQQSSCAIAGIQGVAGGATKLFLNVDIDSTVYQLAAAPNTATGGTVGNDVQVAGGVPFAVAQLANYVNFRSPIGTFQHTTDNPAAPTHSNTVNKLSGREALAAGGTAIFTITNGLARGPAGGLPGDSCFVQLETRDGTAVAPIAVVTDNTITITFAAAATGTTVFSWWLKKSTV